MSKGTAEGFRDPLEDQGWQQMKKLLDQEMPEKKRRVLWWPWMGIAAAGLILWLGYEVFLIPGKQDAVQSLSQAEGVYPVDRETTEKAREGSDFNSIDEPLDQEEIAISEANAYSIHQGNNRDQPSAAERVNMTKNDLTFNNNKGSARSEAVLNFDQGKKQDDNSTVFSTIDSSGRENDLIDDKGKEKSRIATPVVALSQPHLKLSRLYGINPNLFPIKSPLPPSIKRERNSQFDLGLFSALISELKFKKPSVDLGINLRFRPVRYLTVGSGAYFWNVHSYETFAANDHSTGILGSSANDRADALVAIPEMQDQDTTRMPTVGNDSYIRTIKNISYLRIPVYIQFFPDAKWQPYIGLDRVILLSDGRNGLLKGNVQYDTASNGANPVAFFELVRRANTTLVVGVSHQLNEHWFFDLSYHRAQKSYLNYEVSKGTFYEYHRFVRLGLGYRF